MTMKYSSKIRMVGNRKVVLVLCTAREMLSEGESSVARVRAGHVVAGFKLLK